MYSCGLLGLWNSGAFSKVIARAHRRLSTIPRAFNANIL